MAAPNPAPPARPGKRRRSGNPDSELRFALDTCSKNKDVAGAIALYDDAVAAGLRLGPYHFNSLLYLCSASPDPADADKGFEIFRRMLAAGVAPGEATVTAAARLAAAKGDGDLAFRLAAEMGEKYKVPPKLRTYGPALFWFCEKGELDKALAVEEDMVRKGVELEEPEIAALLRASAEGRRGDKVYYFMQRLRAAVKAVNEETAEVVGTWFLGAAAAEEGRVGWDWEEVRRVMGANGGGWHGLGWLGKGDWDVCRTRINPDGRCLHCETALVCVDTDVPETEKFAKSIAALALQREARARFGEFQVEEIFLLCLLN